MVSQLERAARENYRHPSEADRRPLHKGTGEHHEERVGYGAELGQPSGNVVCPRCGVLTRECSEAPPLAG